MLKVMSYKRNQMENEAVNLWRQGANEVVNDAKTGGEPFFAADSIFRPNNMNLWLSLKQAQPEWSFDTPERYDQLMAEQLRRVQDAARGK